MRRKTIRRDARGEPYLDYAHGNDETVTDVRNHLRDGERLRVPHYLQDAARRPQEEEEEEFNARDSTELREVLRGLTEKDRNDLAGLLQDLNTPTPKHDGFVTDHRPGGPFVVDHRARPPLDAAQHQPGFRTWTPPAHSVDHARAVTAAAMLDEAYRDYDIAMMNAHKSNPDERRSDDQPFGLQRYETGAGAPGVGSGAPPGGYPYTPQDEGRACTINGQDGHLVREGNWLVCRPTSARSDAMPVMDATEQAYRQYDEEQAEAWRRSS